MSDLFSLRAAKPSDIDLLNAYAYGEGMDDLPSLDRVKVAVNDADEPVGFVRIALDDSGTAFINPVVVYSAWRGYGVGRALIESALQEYGELRLVSRGSSRGFYQALGFEDCGWDAISEGVTDDCIHCDIREECGPQPMRRISGDAR